MENKKVIFSIILGDIIGFKNGEWSTKYNEQRITYENSLELLFEFISLGGINNIDITNWETSINSVIISSLYKIIKNNADEIIIDKFKKEFTNIVEKNTSIPNIGIDISMEMSIKNYFDTTYSINSSEGNGAVWCSIIGLFEFKLERIIDLSINLCKLVYSSPYGYLGGMTSAYFTFLAKNKVPINNWVFKLIKLLKSKKIKKHIGKSDNEKSDYMGFINMWTKYLETRFNEGSPIITKSTTNVLFRSKYYYDNFAQIIGTKKIIGKTGCDACIVAYDSLLDSGNVWEKLVIYSMLNPGDTNVTGSLASCWYSILYGDENIPKHFFDEATNGVNEKFFSDVN